MGWNPWNLFGCDGINEQLIQDIASSMVSTGLSDLGYQYINLDDCWQVSRNETGHIVVDAKKFPSGMASLSREVHSRGLKFGLYSDSGLYTCQRRPGGLGYETRDAESYVEWDIDYLKYDNCYATGLGGGVQKRYETMRDALNKTATNKSKSPEQKPIFFGLCEWGYKDPATWAKPVGNSWRTTGDIQKSWNSILANLDQNDQWHSYAGPGGWNDPDMLQVGTTNKLTIAEQRAHFTLWCLVKSPLLLANDLRDIPPEIMEIISNPEVIALNQDPLGIQGYKRSSNNDLEVWAADLKGGDIGVVLLNRSGHNQTIQVRFEDVVNADSVRIRVRRALADEDEDERIAGFAHTLVHIRGGHRNAVTTTATTATTTTTISAHVRDLWARSDLGVYQDAFEGTVPTHDVMALRLTKVTAMIPANNNKNNNNNGNDDKKEKGIEQRSQ
jgi:alpha-galactosidase